MTRRVIFVGDDYWRDPPKENLMSEERDLSEGFPEYQRPPRDIVPHTPDPNAPPIPTGPGQTVTVTEWDENGVTRTEHDAFVMPAITNLDDLYRRNNTDD